MEYLQNFDWNILKETGILILWFIYYTILIHVTAVTFSRILANINVAEENLISSIFLTSLLWASFIIIHFN